MIRTALLFSLVVGAATAQERPIPELPVGARLAFEEDWSSGTIDSKRWYALRKKWGKGNSGVVPENVRVVEDIVDGKPVKVLQCTANGDQYDGDVTGQWKKKARVGGVLVTKPHFASGRFEVRMKIGDPDNPTPPGIVPAIWTYGYRAVRVKPELADQFLRDTPLYHPYLQEWGKGTAFFWSEIDFPEFGKKGDYERPMYNTFLNKKHHSMNFDCNGAADGKFHTYVTEWRTHLVPIEGVSDAQVEDAEGYYWLRDKKVPWEKYWGNPLKRLGKDEFAVCAGKSASHWIDGSFIGENTTFVPSMSAQLNIGVWLPEWAGVAPWKTANVRFGRIRVWQFDDSGDVAGILTENITNNFNADGQLVRAKVEK